MWQTRTDPAHQRAPVMFDGSDEGALRRQEFVILLMKFLSKLGA